MDITAVAEYEQFIKKHAVTKGEPFTHTRIGDVSQNIYPGSFFIPQEDYAEFIKKYFKYVFINGKKEYLTEKQNIESGPLIIDIDLRYDKTVEEKQHTEDHIMDAVMEYANKISTLLTITQNAKMEVFVMEKTKVNNLPELTKDGIHIIFGIKMHKALQMMLRNRVIDTLADIWTDLPITNEWDKVLDEGIAKGFVNWQMYGSRKPGNQSYLIKQHIILTYVVGEYGGDWAPEIQNIKTFSTEKNLEKMSAHYQKFPEFVMKEEFKDEFETEKNNLSKSSATGGSKKKPTRKYKTTNAPSDNSAIAIDYSSIDSEAILDEMIANLFEDIGPCNYRIKETHQYTMCLPESYYGPGSFTKWIRVGWALANTSPKLFLTWVKFSCQENCRNKLRGSNGKFDWSCVKELYDKWQTFETNNPDKLSHRSIMFWCKNDAKAKYKAIHNETIEYFIEQTINQKVATEHDLAMVLFNMFKDDFVCVSIRNGTWYEYINHRWHEIDSGNTLRLQISRDMHFIYHQKILENVVKIQTFEQGDPKGDALREQNNNLANICAMLKRTNSKNNIMREAKEIFYDNTFIEKLDTKPNLLCFNNYVIDFDEKTHRKGQPDDYISKCTNIDYVVLDRVKHAKIIKEIDDFMSQLFPNKELREYMWAHLASCLIGTTSNQTFHVYKGTGRNGKTILITLLGKGFGTYKGLVPISLVTQKRNSIGNTSSEVAQLIGVRLAVMQEMSKGDKMNEGIVKEITGGDPIQARALFKDAVTFKPMFNLVLATNDDFDDLSNSDSIWRRMRYIDFGSKFLEKPYEDEIKFPRSQCPHQFPLDKDLEKKFDDWAPIFMSMLVEVAYKTNGIVKDCKIVMDNCDLHRDKQDYFTAFAKEKIQESVGGKIKKDELLKEFKQWYLVNYGKGGPKGSEITEFMNNRFGVFNRGWHNIAILYDEAPFQL